MSTVIGGSQGSGNPPVADQGGGNPPAAGGTKDGGTPPAAAVGAPASWRDSIPENIRNEPSLKTFTDVGALAQSYIHAQQAIGKKGVILPTDKSTEEDWTRFYKEVGVPELDKYEMKLPEGVKADEPLVTKFKEWSQKNGLLPKQAQAIFENYVGLQKENATAMAEAKKAAQTEKVNGLKKEWGDGFARQAALANFAVEKLGGDEAMKYFGANPELGNDPVVAKLLAKAGAVLGGDQTIKGDGSGKFGKTPQEIQTDIERLSVHPGYANRNHPEHTRINRELEGLYKTLYAPKAG